MSALIRFCSAMLMVLVIAPSYAQDESAKPDANKAKDGSAHAVVQKVTDDVLAVVENNKKTLESDPAKYFSGVQTVLEPVVAFDYIAKVVMAQHYKAASEAQREQFAETFKKSMVKTFAKGMANYSDFDIEVQVPSDDVSDQRKVEVLQEVSTNDGKHIVSYTMAQTRSGEWKLINVVLNGINLGKSFRDQFLQAMRQHSNDLDKVIATWGQSETSIPKS